MYPWLKQSLHHSIHNDKPICLTMFHKMHKERLKRLVESKLGEKQQKRKQTINKM